MEQYGVLIPGTGPELYLVYASNKADAIAEALRSHGLTFAPPGTDAVPGRDLRALDLDGVSTLNVSWPVGGG